MSNLKSIGVLPYTMNVYSIRTSNRVGYTYEKPTLKYCIEIDELLYDKTSCEEPVLCGPHSTTLYEVYCVRNVRGDLEKADFKLFLALSDAETYFESVKGNISNKMVQPHMIKKVTIYNKILDIPRREPPIRISPMELDWQKRQYEDDGLTDEQKLERYIAERNTPLV